MRKIEDIIIHVHNNTPLYHVFYIGNIIMNNTIIIYNKFKHIIFSFCNNGVYDDTESLINPTLDLMGNIVLILRDHEDISFTGKRIFIVDNLSISFDYRNDIAHVMFELLNISAFYISSHSMLCLYDNDITSGVVISYYNNNKIQIVPIHNKKIMKVNEMKTTNINMDKIKKK